MKSRNVGKTISIVLAILLCLALAAGSAFASSCGGSSGGGGSTGGGGKSKATKEATSSFNRSEKAAKKMAAAKKEKGGGSGKSVDLTTPGTAVTAQQGQPPSSEKGISDADRGRLDGISVNKGAPTPTKLQ